MTTLSQSPRDRAIWILANNGGKMERSRLRAATGMRYAHLNPILEELAREGRITHAVGKSLPTPADFDKKEGNLCLTKYSSLPKV